MSLSPYLKAVVGAIIAGLGAAATAAIDNSIVMAEWIGIASAFFVALYAIWQTPNKP